MFLRNVGIRLQDYTVSTQKVCLKVNNMKILQSVCSTRHPTQYGDFGSHGMSKIDLSNILMMT
jgi:hypothetical protein